MQLQMQLDELQMTDQSSQYFIANQRAQVPFIYHEIFKCNHYGFSYTNKRHGIRVIIPEGAITVGEKVHFEIGLTWYDRFHFLENTRPISPILWICSLEKNVKLNKRFKIVLPHFLTGLSKNKANELKICFSKANHNNFIIQNDKILYRFESLGAEPQLFNYEGYSYGAMETRHCCFYCLQAGQSQQLEANTTFCLARISELSTKPLQHTLYFVAVYFLETCIRAVEEQYPEESYVRPVCRKFNFATISAGDSPYIEVIPEKSKKYITAMDPEEAKVYNHTIRIIIIS